MERFLSSNGRISTHFDDIHIKLSKHGYFEVRFHSILSNMKILKLDFVTSSSLNPIHASGPFIYYVHTVLAGI